MIGRNFLSFCAGFCILLFVSVAHAQLPQVANGVTYLTSAQNVDGTWGNDASKVDATVATVTALDALKLLNESAGAPYSTGLSWLQGQSPQSVAYTADRIRVLGLGAGSLDALLGALDQLKGAWGGEEGYETDILDTAIVLQALRSADYADATVTNKALAYLTANQNPDSGWGFCQGDTSNVYMTAVVSSTLQQFPQVTSIATAVNTASSYLLGRQNSDGGFGSSDSTTYETALAFSALVAVSGDTSALTSAVNYLAATQAADGSWQEDPYSTALALKALYFSENKPSAPPPPPAGGIITGTVVDAVTKARVPGVSISLVNNSLINTTSDSSGNFKILDVPPGAQGVSFSLTGYAAKTASADVTVGGVTNLGTVGLLSSYATGYIAGTITDSAGKALANATVTVTGAWSGSATTGSDGSYSFNYVVPGEMTITAAKAGYVAVTGGGTVYARTKLSFSPRLSVTTPQGTTGTLVGRVIDSYWGVPIGHLPEEKGVTVTVSGGISVAPDDNGYFTIPGLAPNTYQVTVGMNGFATQTFRAVVMPGIATDLGTIRLEMTVSEMALTGIITDAASGAPIPGAEVAIVGTDLSGRADFAGTYAIAGIKLASQLTIKVSASGYTGRTLVMNSAPWTHTIDFSLVPQVTTGGLTGTVVDALSGTPLEGVSLSLADAPEITATSGVGGVFTFRSLQPGTHKVTLSLPGYSSRALTTAITVGAVSDVGMIAISTDSLPAAVQGRVWDAPANAPFAGVVVKAFGTNALDTVSATDGTYRIEKIEPGYVTIATGGIPKTGYGSARYSAQLEPGGVLVFNPVLSTSLPATVDLSLQSDKGVYRVGESASVAIHVQNRQSVETPATLYLQVFDPYGAVVFESSNDVAVSADGQSDLPVSVALPAAAVPGTYRVVLSAYAPNGSLLRDAVAGFGVAVSQVAVTPMLPSVFTAGSNTFSFSLNNQGILPVSVGSLVVTLKDPDGQVVSSSATPFSLDAGQTVNLSPTVNFPALKLGSYTLAYVVNDETRNGVATELQIPNSYSIAGLYDDTSRRVRNTANLTVTLGNTGRLNIPAGPSDAGATVTVSVPDTGYSETKPLATVPAAGGAASTSVGFSFVIPETINAGQHATKITLTMPSGSSQSQNAMLTITESSLILASVQGAYTAGDIIHTAFANSGGVDTQVQYRMSLYDAKSKLIAERSATDGILAGSTFPLDLVIPTGAVDGSYNLVIAYTDLKTGKDAVSQNPITVRGVKGTLQVQTGKENYLLTENITGTSAISNTGMSLDGGTLHLQVVTGPGSEKKKTWTTQADFQTGVRNGVDTYGVNDWIIPDDDFDAGALDTNKWSASGTVTVQSGLLNLDTNPALRSSSIGSKWLLEGDFDIQVDFSKNMSTSWTGAQFTINWGGGNYFYIGNYQAPGYSSTVVENNHTMINRTAGAPAISGRFRLSRNANTVTSYYWSGASWVEVVRYDSTNDAIPLSGTGYVSIAIYRDPAYPGATASFDNFRVNSGRIKTENQTVDSVRLLPLNDNFDDGVLNEDRWTNNLVSPYTETLGNLHITTNKASNARLKFKIPGDFSVVTKFKNFWSQPIVFLGGCGLNVYAGTSGVYLWRQSDGVRAGGQFIAGMTNIGTDYQLPYLAPYTSDSGVLRVKRTSDVFYNDYLDGTNWITNHFRSGMSTDPATVDLYTNVQLQMPTTNVDFDYFYTNKGNYASNGTLNLKHDSGNTNTVWEKLQYSAIQPMGTSNKFRTRTAESEEGLTTALWSDYITTSGAPITSLPARWIEVEASLATTNTNVTPLLNDLSVTYESAPGEVLWQTDVPAGLAEGTMTNLDSVIGTLPVAGKLYLQGSLLSGTGQTVATAEYPFYIEQGNTQVVLGPDKKIYRPGETVTVIGEAKNFSAVAASGLTLDVKGNDGSSLHSETFDLAAGSVRPFSFSTVAGNDGVYRISGSLAQNGTTLAETADQYEVVTPVLSAVFTAPDTVGDAPFTVSVSVGNTGRVDATVTVRVVDDAGEVIGEQAMTLPPGETRVAQFSHQVYAATVYRAILTGDLAQTLTKSVSYSVVGAGSDGGVTSKIFPDRVSYKPNEQVALSTTVASASMRDNLSAIVSILNGRQEAVYSATSAIPTLVQGQTLSMKSYWNCGSYPPGTYLAGVKILDATGQVVSSASCNVVIESVSNPAALLTGKVTLDKQSILTSDPVSIVYSVTNSGNVDVGLLSTWIRVIDIDGTVLFSTADEAALAIGATHVGTGRVETVGYGAKDYIVMLGATIGGVEEVLGSTYFRIEGAPSVPALFKPAGGADVDTATPTLSVSNAADPNDDKLSYAFEVYSDRAMTTLVGSGTVPETSGVTSWTVPEALIENGTYFWRARAYDGQLYGMWMDIASFRVNTVNDPPSAPTVSGPVDGSAVAVPNPILVVNNAADPDSTDLTYNFDVSLDPQFSQIVASVKGVASGSGTTSWEVPVSLQENTSYYWRAQADDWLVESPWSATAAFFVNTTNDAPSAPAVVTPATGATVASLATDVVVRNSVDPDSIALSYYFEADTAATFDSADLIRSGPIAQGEGGTVWHVAGLKDNTRHFVRVKASDGAAESLWSAVSDFFVNTVNDPPTPPVLANPSDGSGVNVFNPILSVHNATDLDHDALTYQFAVYADAAMMQVVAGADAIAETGAITSWQIPQLLTENMTYYWKVRAFDGVLYGEWMPAASFTVNTANDAPSAPRPYFPADHGSVETTTPLLQVSNATDPDSVRLSYDFEIYSGSSLVASGTRIPGDASGVTGWAPGTPLAGDAVYQWRARAYDGASYGPWTALTSFTVHLPVMSINAAVNFDPDTLNRTSNGTWVVVYIELPKGYRAADIDVSSIRLEGAVPAEMRPSSLGDHDKDGIADLMVKFRRDTVIGSLPAGDKVPVHVSGKVGDVAFEGVDVIRVIK